VPELSQAASPAEAPVAMEPRVVNPGAVIPEAWEGIQKLLVAVRNVSTRQPAGDG
jgi:hypothetical protein